MRDFAHSLIEAMTRNSLQCCMPCVSIGLFQVLKNRFSDCYFIKREIIKILMNFMFVEDESLLSIFLNDDVYSSAFQVVSLMNPG
jgi:hypothetical protein